jgi:putative PEP-CTERM system TPR-repeat lipoprotein
MKGDPAGASAEVRSVLEKEPANLSALALRAEAEFKHGHGDQALATCESILKKAPGNREALRFKALLLMDQRRPGDALAAADLLTKSPLNASEGYELRGRALFAMNDIAGALAAMQKAISLRPGDWALHQQAARYHLAHGEPEQALNQVQQALSFRPGHEDLRLLAALIHLKRNKADEALREANSVLAANPGKAAAHFAAGSALLSLGRQSQGMQALDRALRLDPDLIEARIRRSSVHLARGRVREAEADLERALVSDPDRQSTRLLLASFYLLQNQPSRAAAAARQGLRGGTEDAVLYNLIAETEIRQGRLDEALVPLDKARVADPKHPAAFLRTAVLYRVRGEQERAADLLNGFARSTPAHAGIQLATAALLERTGRRSEAEELYERARSTGSPETARVLAVRMAGNGRTGEALALLDQALRKRPGDAVLLALCVEIATAGKRYTEAVRAAEELMRLDAVLGLRLVAATHVAEGRPDKAFARIERELQRSPEEQQLQAELCRLQLRTNKPREARATAEAMVRRLPGSPAGYLLLAETQLAAGDPDSARATLRSAPLRNSHDAALLLAALEEARKDRRAALAELVRAEALGAPGVEVNLRKAALLQASGRTREAAAAYREVLDSSPDHVPALNNLAYLLAEDPRTAASALPLAVRAAMLAPDESAVQDTLGYVLVRNSKTKAGLQILKQASSLAPGDPVIDYHLALALEDSRDRAGAVAHLEKALSRGEFPERAAAATLLAGLSSRP